MLSFRSIALRLAIACLLLLSLAPLCKAETLVVGYVFPQNNRLQPGQVDPLALNRINYAFASLRDGQVVEGYPSDADNLKYLVSLRKQNPSLTILISVGGWLGSGGFSDMALTSQSRARFIESALTYIDLHHLDGIDIDWEYPGLPGAGHAFRREDKQNFTYLIAELRARLDLAAKAAGRKLYLTIAAGASDDFLANTEMAKVQGFLDSVNLMAYDYYEPDSDSRTGHHAPLFANPADPKHVSADASVRALLAAGVPAPKILLGVPFYGRQWENVPDRSHGLYQSGHASSQNSIRFGEIDANHLPAGFTRYWDSTSSVPFLYNAQLHLFISYEDPQSLSLKSRYVRSHHLGGVMFWDYSSDPSGKLLHAINSTLHPSPKPKTVPAR